MAKTQHSLVEVEDFGKRAHYRPYLVWICLFMSMGSITFGFSAANIGITLTQPSFITAMGLDTATNVPDLISAMNATWYGGGIIGACLHGWVANKWGRRASIACGCTFVLVSSAILTGTANVAMFIAFRFFNGLGCFQCTAGVPLWITEIVPPKHRGVLGDIHAIGLNVGYCISAYVGVGFFYTNQPNAWRPPIALQILPPLVVLLGIYWIPESPRWLLTKGRDEQAWEIIRRLHTSSHDVDDSFAQTEFRQMKIQIEFEATLESSYMYILKRPSMRKRALMTVFLTFSMFSTGILVVNNYGSILYHSLGYGAADSLQFQAGYILNCLTFNIVALLIVDRVKRNVLISFGFAVVCTCLLIETVLQAQYIGTTNQAGLAACVAVIYLFAFAFSMFLDGPCYFYIAEIWPTHLRAKGYAIGIATLAATNLLWLIAAPTAFATISWRFYILFVVLCAIACVVSAIWFPNTLHKPLEEIASMFGDHDLVAAQESFMAVHGSDDINAEEKGGATSSEVSDTSNQEQKAAKERVRTQHVESA